MVAQRHTMALDACQGPNSAQHRDGAYSMIKATLRGTWNLRK